MGKDSKIAWTDHTHNIVWGCEKVSPACDNCYAEELDAFYNGENNHWGDKPRKIMADRYWKQPLRWDKEAAAAGKRALVFCSSMADVFENNEQVESQRPRLWELIKQTPNLRWLLLTKRPQNIRRMLPKDLWDRDNIWLGTTVESPDYLWRVDKVCEVPAPVHFVSMEPLLAMISRKQLEKRCHPMGFGRNSLNWLISGCESGDKSRPTPIDWYREIRDAARAHLVAFLFKQAPHKVEGIAMGPGAWLKFNRSTAHPDTGARMRGIVEQPYLDGQQWIQFPDLRTDVTTTQVGGAVVVRPA